MTVLRALAVETRLGWAGVALSPAGIRHSSLFEETEAAAFAWFKKGGEVSFGDDPRFEAITNSLRQFAVDGGGQLDLYPVDLPACSEFERSAWMALRDIPRGETRSYGWLARHVGAPASAVRAVGQAMGANPIPLWLPCHRVVASDGSLHGFGGGLAMKRALLELEGALPRPLFALA